MDKISQVKTYLCELQKSIDRWVEGMLHLFAPQIQWVNTARDKTIAHYKTIYPDRNVYEDPQLDLLSAIPINLNQQIQWILNEDLVEVCTED